MSIGLLAPAAYLAAGILSGTLYFLCVWWNAGWIVRRGGTWTTVPPVLGRIVVLGGLLTLAARHGAMPLLLMALGLFLARFAVMRGLRATAP